MITKPYNGRKYFLNEAFFDTWSAEMAYVLGFWFADGNMRHDRSYRILFTSNDMQILEAIRSSLSSNSPIIDNNHDQSFSLACYSKKVYEKLEELGGMECKSRFVRFPYVSQEYIRDFIRGYFDGDGSVFFVQYTRTKDKRWTMELRTNFTSGSRKFLEDLIEVLHREIGLPMKEIGAYNHGDSLKLGYGMKDSDTLLRYMYYKNFPIGLERKATFVSRIPIYERHTT